MKRRELDRIRAQLLQGPVGRFSPDDIAGLPEPVRRYLTASIAPGTPLFRSARIEMKGTIKLGRWLPFRARQVLNPHAGFVWNARVMGLIAGADRYAGGRGGMEWKLAGIKKIVHAEGPDVSRSAVARGAAEGMWLPTALMPVHGVTWIADDDTHIRANWAIDGHAFGAAFTTGADGVPTSVVFDRWGDPDGTGTWGVLPFGGELTRYARFGGLTIPSEGRVGWYYGTDRWPDGEFFRYRITDLEPVVAGVPEA